MITATILKDLSVGLPRDRGIEDPRLVELQRMILDTLGVTDGKGARR